MEMTKVSPKFQVVIPKKIREMMEIRSGESLQIFVLDGSIRICRPKSIKDLHGIAKGMKWKDAYRDRNDRY